MQTTLISIQIGDFWSIFVGRNNSESRAIIWG